MEEKKKKKRIWLPVVIIVLAALVIAPALVRRAAYVPARQAWSEAIELVEEGRYDEAEDALTQLARTYPSYKYPKFDTTDLYDLSRLCQAHVMYEYLYDEESRYRLPLSYIKYLDLSAIGSEPIQEDLEEFRALLEEEQSAYLQKTQQETDGEEALSENTYVPEVPYVGMSESSINSTRLGAASSTGHNNEMISGQVVTANLYYYKVGDTTIFSARCIDGKVVQVWDYRDKLTSSSTSSSSSSSSSTKSDPYNVYAYDDPEEFYYDNYDDFDSYEDADDYWRDYQ